jgi:hypothetical protein
MEGNKCVDRKDWHYPKDGECKGIPIKNWKTGDAEKCVECNKAVSYLDDKKAMLWLPKSLYFIRPL